MKFVKYGVIALIILALLGVAAFAFLGMQSRNGAAAGLIEGRLSECPTSPNCISSETGTPEEKKVAALPLSAWPNLPDLMTAMGGEVTAQDEAYISAEFTSSTFGFVDDVEFRLTETDVQVRSASRVGHSDAGVNAARVAEIRAQLASE